MNQLDIAIQIAVNQWELTVNIGTKNLNQLSDTSLDQQVAPGKNTGKYIIGHLIAINDAMPELLGIGESVHPELVQTYIKQPDGSADNPKTVHQLRELWTETHDRVTNIIKGLPAEDWLARHNAMTDNEYTKNPLRNRLSLLTSRINHFSYHIGQLRLLIS